MLFALLPVHLCIIGPMLANFRLHGVLCGPTCGGVHAIPSRGVWKDAQHLTGYHGTCQKQGLPWARASTAILPALENGNFYQWWWSSANPWVSLGWGFWRSGTSSGTLVEPLKTVNEINVFCCEWSLCTLCQSQSITTTPCRSTPCRSVSWHVYI